MEDEREHYTATQLALKVGFKSRYRIHQMIKKGEIKAEKIGGKWIINKSEAEKVERRRKEWSWRKKDD